MFPVYLMFVAFEQVWFNHIGHRSPYNSEMGATPLGHMVLLFINTLIVGQDLYQSPVAGSTRPFLCLIQS
jgi:hypothetical protein